jgi:transcription-repair coupling factor (superfamily II helicase)
MTQGSHDPDTRLRDLADVVARVASREGLVRLTGLRGAAKAVVGARLVAAHAGRPVLFVTPTAKAGDALLEDLRTALAEPPPEEGGRVRPFPRHDTVPYDRFSPQPFLVAQRMDVLHRWLACQTPGDASEPAPVVVAPWTALALRVPTRARIAARSVRLAVGEEVERDALVETLVAAGYARQPLVEERGEIALRGGILDVFPPNRARPVRVELLGDTIESIREFDPASQRSQKPIDACVAPPPRELLVDREWVVLRGDAILAFGAHQRVPPREMDALLSGLLRGHLPPGAEALAALVQDGLDSVFDFLPDDALVVLDEPDAGRERMRAFERECFENFDSAHHAHRPACPPSELYLLHDALEAALAARRPIALERLDVEGGAGERFAVRSFGNDELRRDLAAARSRERALLPLAEQLALWCSDRRRVVIAAHALSGAERLVDLLSRYGLAARLASRPAPAWSWSEPGRIEVRVAALSEGFVLPIEGLAVVTEEEIFGPRERHRSRSDFRAGAALVALAQLAPGDPLVHAEHGIGIYRGLVELDLGRMRGEFLRIEYEGGDRLFVPVHRLNLVQRYVGAEGHTPRLDRLGGSTWEKAKRGVRRALRDMAGELLAVHAARELAPGHAYGPRDRYLEEFEGRFPYDETPDQAAAIEDVLADLAKPRPMDRLVCGDVGFGKTEVACRAAFKVVMEGRQVAVLVPTTILCQQHTETFRRRFEGYPVRIESLSRFQTPAEARAIQEGLASGAVDLAVGTHRLLQKQLQFRDLGLLVVDEEHRFGVAHKERLKKLKQTVDVLTLTATPIPRTLQMAFSGLRDLSTIQTPPADRLAVRTQVARFSDSLVREAILREVRRGGQVFFVHNRVQTIAAMAELLARVVPEVRVLVAHGQMRERELEDRMLAFLRGEADVLLCTTIIESGLDMPRVNTILVNRADTLGLAQLYQLRGRVGRSHHRAYCYLLVPGEESMTEDARRRLEAIQELAELGSGFRLASMDLEIRGAGNLLGAEQSGNLAAVGYDTYMEMLEEAIEELRGVVREVTVDPEIRLPVDARLPEALVPDVPTRLVLYKRLAGARDDAEVDAIRDELLDRFGPLPEPARNLLALIRIKVRARALGVATVELSKGAIVLTAAAASRIDPDRLVGLLTRPRAGVRVLPDQKISAPAPESSDADALFEATDRLLAELGGLTSPPARDPRRADC